MTRNLEERIQQLCKQVEATEDDEELIGLCVELREALQEHIRNLREQVAGYRRSSKTKTRTGT